jgi:uncharacterized membrane protein (UPF0127 family)
MMTLLCWGCQPEQDVQQEPATAQTYFPIAIGDQALQLQLALNSAEQQKGLMHRDSLHEDHGMLFLFKQPEPRGFWMKNTNIPLDIGYFDASGRLLEIHQMFPHDETPVYSSSQEVLIAVETNQGWYAAHGITPGAQLDMQALQQGLKRRHHKSSALQP